MSNLLMPSVLLPCAVVIAFLLGIGLYWLSRMTPERIERIERSGSIFGLLLGLFVTVVVILRARRQAAPETIAAAHLDEKKTIDAIEEKRIEAVKAADAVHDREAGQNFDDWLAEREASRK